MKNAKPFFRRATAQGEMCQDDSLGKTEALNFSGFRGQSGW